VNNPVDSETNFQPAPWSTLFLRRIFAKTEPQWDDSTPIRSEFFSVERLEEHARTLAAAQQVTPGVQKGASLTARLTENETILVAAYRDIAQTVDTGSAITPAAEWLLDNFHIVEKQIREIRSDLPPGYYRQLPKLAGGPFANYPRVFGVAWAFVAHTDSLFDPEILFRYLRAYQEIQPLTIGELWAVSITLRIVLVENLRRIARRVIDSRAGRKAADRLADALLEISGAVSAPTDVKLPLHQHGAFSDSFLVQLVHRLRGNDPGVAPALTWLDDQLAMQGTTTEAVVREEHQKQVSGTITVRNVITSMRLITNIDWTEFFERICLVDTIFDQYSGYQKMDFPTRSLYRNAVEELSRGSGRSELEIAQCAIAAAQWAQTSNGKADGSRYTDPGYYLIAEGRTAFEAEIDFKPSMLMWPGRFYRALGIGGYVSAGLILAACFLSLPLSFMLAAGIPPVWLWTAGIVAFIPTLDLAVAVVNYIVTSGFRAVLLPAMDYRAGIPDTLRSLVVMPILLTSARDIKELVERLEIHYLASPPGALHFALLSDWTDGAHEQMVGDDALLAIAADGIAQLNQKYGSALSGHRFLLLHRRRVWNEGEQRWIGWERKRGKLCELNQLLRGKQNTTFLSPPDVPPDIRFVITLDADTCLPRDTVGRLIGKMAHPLNQPGYDAELGRVVARKRTLSPRLAPRLVARSVPIMISSLANVAFPDTRKSAMRMILK
jgi:cyclic beta-1,2-glucan synthetase